MYMHIFVLRRPIYSFNLSTYFSASLGTCLNARVGLCVLVCAHMFAFTHVSVCWPACVCIWLCMYTNTNIYCYVG